MLRFPLLAFVLVLPSCGGRATDTPGFRDDGEFLAQPGDGDSTNQNPEGPEVLCPTICAAWSNCGPVSEDDCRDGCFMGYAEAESIDCGNEYGSILQCNLDEGVCDLESDCVAQGDAYVACVDENF